MKKLLTLLLLPLCAHAQVLSFSPGSSAYQNTGTSGATVPLLNGTNTWSAQQTFSSTVIQSATTFLSTVQENNIKIMVNVAPTIASGFGTSPTVAHHAFTPAFDINVGTSTITNPGVVTMPATTDHWSCHCIDSTNPDTINTECWGTSTTSITIKGYSRTTGVATAWTASDVLQCTATGV